jgi:hypothetical protein
VQPEEHVSVPFVHGWVAPAAHAPPPEQADQADHTPALHVRVALPVM